MPKPTPAPVLTPVPDHTPFQDLIRRVRAGDERAAEDVVRQYEDAVRRAVRFRLHRTRYQRLLDSRDICQQVLLSFFVRAALGQFNLASPADLVGLLKTMARNKLENEIRRLRARRRDIARDVPGDAADWETVAAGADPSERASLQELVRKSLARLSDEERQLVELRRAGHDWESIAAQLGGTPEARRKQYERAVARVAEDF